MDEVAEAILRLLPPIDSMGRDELQQALGHDQRGAVSHEAFKAAAERLVNEQLIERFGLGYRRTEPDCAEADLYEDIERHLRSPEFLEKIKIKPDQFVLQNTASGGSRGAGRFSQPDFTLAAITRREYDPARRLDVYSFEAKNRAGADVPAVFEALAQTRFSHFAYLICPRTKLRAAGAQRIRQACAEHGVGLLTFTLSVGVGKVSLSEWMIELFAARREPDPDEVEQHLSRRLTKGLLDRLKQISRGEY